MKETGTPPPPPPRASEPQPEPARRPGVLVPGEVNGDETVRDAIHSLIQLKGGSPDADIVSEIIGTALKLVEAKARRGDLKVINSTLKDMRYAFKIFSQYGKVPKVSIFGSARTQPDAPEYGQAREFARLMADSGYMVITGAGDGIMRAGNEGAGKEMSFGVNIRLPFEQNANDIILDDPKLINFKYFFVRKLCFIKETDAVAMFPGGFGTMDEAFEVVTLVQTGKSEPMPLVFVDQPGGTYWKAWENYVKGHLLEGRYMSAEDLNLFHITDDPHEARDVILRFYRNFHSTRQVRKTLVVRMKYPATAALLEQLNVEFGDLLHGGKIEAGGPLPEEANEPELNSLPRLYVPFNRRNHGRFRALIDALNASAPPSPTEVAARKHHG
jgi:uncharacterized protein (TIGR00730 family)